MPAKTQKVVVLRSPALIQKKNNSKVDGVFNSQHGEDLNFVLQGLHEMGIASLLIDETDFNSEKKLEKGKQPRIIIVPGMRTCHEETFQKLIDYADQGWIVFATADSFYFRWKDEEHTERVITERISDLFHLSNGSFAESHAGFETIELNFPRTRFEWLSEGLNSPTQYSKKGIFGVEGESKLLRWHGDAKCIKITTDADGKEKKLERIFPIFLIREFESGGLFIYSAAKPSGIENSRQIFRNLYRHSILPIEENEKSKEIQPASAPKITADPVPMSGNIAGSPNAVAPIHPTPPYQAPGWEKQFKEYWEIIAAFLAALLAIGGSFVDQIVPYIVILAVVGFALAFLHPARWKWNKKFRPWYAGFVFVVAACLGILIWWVSQPHFEVQAFNKLTGDSNAYELSSYLMNDADILGTKYKLNFDLAIQIVPTFYGNRHYGQVVALIYSPGQTPVEKVLWDDFSKNSDPKTVPLTLRELLTASGLSSANNPTTEEQLSQWDTYYAQKEVEIRIVRKSVPEELLEPLKPAPMLTLRHAPWKQHIELIWNGNKPTVLVKLTNLGAKGDFDVYAYFVRADQPVTSQNLLMHSGTTGIGLYRFPEQPVTLGAQDTKTFSYELPEQNKPGRYFIEVYAVKHQNYAKFLDPSINFENYEFAWLFSGEHLFTFFVLSDSNAKAAFSVDADIQQGIDLANTKGVDMGEPIGEAESVTSPRKTQGKRQDFANGVIFAYNGQAYPLYGPIYLHYKAISNGYFPTSQITTIQRENGDAVDMMEFEATRPQDMPSVIYANQKTAAWVEGWIRRMYDQSGGPTDWLGLPMGDQIEQSDTVTQAFEHGYIVYYFPMVNGKQDHDRVPVAIPYVSTFEKNGKIFDVQAATWQDTGLEVKAGQAVWVEYIGGKWTDSTETNPDGYSAGGNSATRYVDGTLFDKAMLGTLIARVGGENGAIFNIGRWSVFIAPTDGKLELAMNDSSYEHNAGLVTVKISISNIK